MEGFLFPYFRYILARDSIEREGGGVLLLAGFAWFWFQYINQCMPYFTLPQRIGAERRALALKIPGSGEPEKLDAQGRLRVTAALAASLGDLDVEIRRGAARRLKQMAEFPDANAAQALPALEHALSDFDEEVATESCKAIHKQLPSHAACYFQPRRNPDGSANQIKWRNFVRARPGKF